MHTSHPSPPPPLLPATVAHLGTGGTASRGTSRPAAAASFSALCPSSQPIPDEVCVLDRWQKGSAGHAEHACLQRAWGVGKSSAVVTHSAAKTMLNASVHAAAMRCGMPPQCATRRSTLQRRTAAARLPLPVNSCCMDMKWADMVCNCVQCRQTRGGRAVTGWRVAGAGRRRLRRRPRPGPE